MSKELPINCVFCEKPLIRGESVVEFNYANAPSGLAHEACAALDAQVREQGNAIEWGLGWKDAQGTSGMFKRDDPLYGILESPYNFEATVGLLVAIAYGPEGHVFPFDEDTDDKVSVYFVGRFNGKIFTLYDYKRDQQIHIGGVADLDVAGLKTELKRLMFDASPAPWRATQRNYVKQTIGFGRNPGPF